MTRKKEPVRFPGDPDHSTIREARDWLYENIKNPALCPTCDQTAMMYQRPITSQTARVLIAMRRIGDGMQWVRFTDLGLPLADEAKARAWGLIEALPGERPDGSKRVGVWRLTPLGVRFVDGEATVVRRMRFYAGESYGPVAGDPQVDIRHCLGRKFDYDALMSGSL